MVLIRKIQDGETYTCSNQYFTAKGGDGYDVFKKTYDEGRVTDLGLSDWQNLEEHLKSLKTIPTKVEGRIVDLEGKAPKENDDNQSSGGSGYSSGGNHTSQPTVVEVSDFTGTPDPLKVHNGDVKVA